MPPSSVLLIAVMACLAAQRGGAIFVGRQVLCRLDDVSRVYSCVLDSVIT